MTHHRSRLVQFVIDVDDLDRGVAFWSAALDATEEPLSERSRPIYRLLRLPDAEIRVLLQRTDDEKVAKERMHLDLETDDIEAEVRRLEALGATRYDHQQERGLTSGSCATPGATSSVCCNRTSPSCSPGAGPGLPSGGTALGIAGLVAGFLKRAGGRLSRREPGSPTTPRLEGAGPGGAGPVRVRRLSQVHGQLRGPPHFVSGCQTHERADCIGRRDGAPSLCVAERLRAADSPGGSGWTPTCCSWSS